MSGNTILIYVLIVVVLFIISQGFGKPFYFLAQACFKGALGAAGIVIFNLVAVIWQISIPLNPFNSLWAGFLGIPGLLSLLAVRYWMAI